MADDVLRQGIQGISELITQPGLINVDFSHIRQMMISGGGSLLSIGHGQGNNKALQAIDRALHHPLIESINLEDATGIIANITGGQDLTFQEVITDDRMEGRVEVILIITGLGATPVDTTSVMQKTGAGLPISQPVEQPLVRQPVATAIPVRAPAPSPAANMPRPGMSASFQPAAAPIHTAQEPQPLPSMRLELASSAANNLDLPAFMRRRIR
jgi:cell division protein FtsZ